jgi:predicted ATPase
MIAKHLILKNWRNFRAVDVELQERMFIVGPNASGKSNLLDVFRFLRDLARQKGGGLQNAIDVRGGLSKIRCLAARQDPLVEIEIHLSELSETWKYKITIKQEVRGNRQPYVEEEIVWKNGKEILRRPTEEDKKDRKRLIQTHLEQINANVEFREIAGDVPKIVETGEAAESCG